MHGGNVQDRNWKVRMLKNKDIGQTDRGRYVAESITTDAGRFSHVGLCQLRTKLSTWPKHPASVVIDSATYLLTISSPDIDNVAMSLYDIIKNKEYEGIRGWSIS